MERKAIILVLCAVAAVGALALVGGARAEPPQTGNWTISSAEMYSGPKELVVNGSIFIEDGASLYLYDVDLTVNSTGRAELTMGTGAQLLIEGGTLRSLGMHVVVNLEHNANINGTTFIDIDGIVIWDWGASVRNCVILDPATIGIFFGPKGDKLMPTTISGNSILRPANYGIAVDVLGAPAGDMSLTVSNNTVTDAGYGGIAVTIDGVTSGALYMGDNYVQRSQNDGITVQVSGVTSLLVDLSGNRVEEAYGNGIYAQLFMQDLKLDANDLYVADCVNYGVVLTVDVPGHGDDVIDNVTTLRSGTFGVMLIGGASTWDKPTLSRFDVEDNTFGGFFLSSVSNAVLTDSKVSNPSAPKSDFLVMDSQLDIYRTVHPFASAYISGGSGERVTSWRLVNLTYVWQNGVPIANRSYIVSDSSGKPAYSGTTDENGWLGEEQVWDWNMNAMGLQTRSSILPELWAPPTWLIGMMINLDKDIDLTVDFTDDVLPDLSLTAPTDGLVMNSTSLTVNGTCTDALSGLRVGMVAFESSTGEMSAWQTWETSGAWEVNLTGLFEGANRIIARAYDVANYPSGSYAEATRSVTVDTVRPWLRVVSPVPAGITPLVTNKDQMLFELAFDSDVVTVLVNGVPSPVTLLGSLTGVIGLVPGSNTVTWTIVDWAGNTNTTRMTIILDVTPPGLTLGLPPGTTYTNVDPYVLTGTTDATDSSVRVNGVEAPVVDGNWTCTVHLVEGENPIAVVATDGAGNTARLTGVVVLDTVPPQVMIFEPGAGWLTNQVPVKVRGAVDSLLIDDVVSVNGVQVDVAAGEFEAMVPVAADGELVITVVGRDLAGNEGRTEVSVLVDTTPPAVAGLSVTDGRLTNDPHLLLSGTVEADSQLRVGGALVDYVGGSFAVALDLVEGRNAVSLDARDKAGNEWTGVINITLDTVAPQLVVDGAVGGHITFGGDGLRITGRTEAGATVLVDVGGVQTPLAVDAMGEFSHTFNLTSDGMSVRVTAVDPAGNSASSDLVADRSVPAPAHSWSGSPAVEAAVAAGSVLIVLGVATTVEVSKYALLVLLLPLYARINKHEVLDNKTRYALHGLILENPGLHYNEIIREFGLTNGVAAYHLHVLEREGFLRAVRDGTLKRFYSVTTKVPQDRRMTPEQIRDAIVTLVERSPGINQREIVDGLGIGRTVVGYHLKALVEEGVLDSSRFGKFTTYKLRPGRRLL